MRLDRFGTSANDEFGSGLPAEGWEPEVDNPEPLDYPPEFERIPLLLKADYLFDGRANSTQTVILADGVDTTRTRVGALALVVHQRDRLTATANFDVRCQNVSLSPEEPDVVLVEGTRTVGSSSVIFGTVPPAGPFLEVIQFAQPVGPAAPCAGA